MSQYNTGTIAVTNGSATITGSGTAFTANVAAGDFFTVVGDNAFYAVASVDSDTQITLAANYAGVTGTGKAYTLVTDFTTYLGFPVPNQGDIETALVVKRAIEEIDSELNTAGIGGDGREWVDLKDTPTYVNATQFTVATDKTSNYHVDRRLRAVDSSTIYGRISASAFAASVTTVTVVWDSGSMTASLSAVALGIGTANSQYPITGSAIKGGTPEVDTIAEATAATGVTIDGVLHKDGFVSSNEPTASSHAATKNYVDAAVVTGVFWKQPVRVASTADLTLSGEQTIDGVLTSADRILVKDQSTGSENGLYVTASGAWARAPDADADAEVIAGIAVYVAEGTANGDKSFTLTTDDPIVVATTALTFAQFGGGTVTAVTGSGAANSSGGSTPDITIDAASSGGPGTLSPGDFDKLAAVAANANNYSHPNHSGDVTSVADGAQTIAANAVSLAKMATMATASLLGRDTAGTGDPEVLSKATALTLLNVADGAEVNPALISQAAAEAGTATTERMFSALRLKQAIDALGASKNNVVLNAFRIAINGGLSVLSMEDGIVDEFEDESGVDTVTSSNEIYDATDDFYDNSASQTLINQGDGTVLGDMTGNGGLAAAFDGTTSQIAANCANQGGDTSYIGKDWGSGNDKIVDGFKTWSSSDEGYSLTATPNITITLQGSTDNFSSSIVDLGSVGPTTDSDGLTMDKLSGLTVTTAYRYHRLKLFAESNNNKYFAEVEFYETPGTDMVLQSNAFAAATPADPIEARIVLFEEDVAVVTLNTDLKAYASRDGGTTWTQITLADEGNYESGKQILAGLADISGQPSGASMKWKLTTHNAKELKLHGVALQWS